MIQLRTLALAITCCLGFASLVQAQTSRPKKSAPEKWAVVKVGSSYQVLLANKVDALKKKLAQDDRDKLANWTKAKKQARKSGRDFDDPKPKKTKLKVISKRLNSETAAKERKSKLEEKERKKREGSKRSRSRPRSRPSTE